MVATSGEVLDEFCGRAVKPVELVGDPSKLDGRLCGCHREVSDTTRQ
jgi:hypothetical protein